MEGWKDGRMCKYFVPICLNRGLSGLRGRGFLDDYMTLMATKKHNLEECATTGTI